MIFIKWQSNCLSFVCENVWWNKLKTFAEFFFGIIQILNLKALCTSGNYWIGLNDLLNEGTFVWDGTSTVSTSCLKKGHCFLIYHLITSFYGWLRMHNKLSSDVLIHLST